MAEDKELDEPLDRLLEGKRPEEILDSEGLVSALTKRLVERALEAELSAHLSYDKHAAQGRNRQNSRNGKGTKRFKTGTAELEISLPRDREGSFEPQPVRKRQRRLAGFDDKVLALNARGMTTRDPGPSAGALRSRGLAHAALGRDRLCSKR